jgi:hypothetical protein
MTEGLLGVNAREISALFVIDYFRSGTGLPNLASDQKDGGQYIRNRKGMAGLLMTYNVPSKNTTQETCSSLSVLLASFQKRLSSSHIQSQTYTIAIKQLRRALRCLDVELRISS